MNDNMYQDQFGFLSSFFNKIEIEYGTIEPLENYREIEEQVRQEQHKDGFFYPPIVKSFNTDIFLGRIIEEIPNTRRPAHLYKLPMSHGIQLDVSGDKQEIRNGIGGLIIYLLSYLLGTRLQFEDWWVDGRIPMKNTHNILLHHTTMEQFISHSCRIWQNWPETAKHLFINILYMNSRTPSYQWVWEQFMINFMVFDACYKLSKELGKIKKKDSRGGMQSKLKAMCETYGLLFDKKNIKIIADLRNQLFHEALWDNELPGMGKGRQAFTHVYNLRRLNQRLIPALLNYQTGYIGTSWLSIGRVKF